MFTNANEYVIMSSISLLKPEIKNQTVVNVNGLFLSGSESSVPGEG